MNDRHTEPVPYGRQPTTIRVTGDPQAEPAAIQADIERTRERMSHTVDQLGERLDPERLKTRMKNNLHDATIGKAENMARRAVDRVDDTRHSLMDNIRDNPMPAAMIGVGLGWLFINSRRDDDDGYSRSYDRYATTPTAYRPLFDDGENLRRGRYYGDQGREEGLGGRASEMGDKVRERSEEIASEARDRAEELTDRAEQLTDRARDRVTGIAHEARETVDQVGDRAQELFDSGRTRARGIASNARRSGHRVEDRFEHMLNDTPLAVGAAAAALGLAIGLSAPPTRREAELMGDTRDRLMDRARERVDEFGDRAQNVASKVADETRSTVREAVEDEGMR